MNTVALANMETLFMALADKTRLRILNMLSEGEICVCFFTEVLGENQPKISRHLAYLRHAGLVSARRDGKWMHYSIEWPNSPAARAAVEAALALVSADPKAGRDIQEYRMVCSKPELLSQIARTPIAFIDPSHPGPAARSRKRNRGATPKKAEARSVKDVEIVLEEESVGEWVEEFEPVREYRNAGHNELEEFLL